MIVPMKRLTLIAMKAEEEPLLRALQSASVVEIIDSHTADGAECAKYESEISRMKSAFSALRPYAEKGSLLSALPETDVESLNEKLPGAISLCETVESLTAKIAEKRAERDKCLARIEQLRPFEALEAPLEKVCSTENAEITAGLIETRSLDTLHELFADQAVEELGTTGRFTAVVLAAAKADSEALFRQLKELPFTEVHFPKETGTAKANIDRMYARIEENKGEEEALSKELASLGARQSELSAGMDAVAIERDREAGKSVLGSTETTFVLEGWVREDETDKLRQTVASVTDCCYIDFRDPTDEEFPPTAVKNNKVVTPYESVVNLYSSPDPHGVDAAPLIAPFYFLFFGMMLSDTGYGIVLALGCWLFLKIKKPTGMFEGIVKVLLMGGISTIFCGFLLGTFFGLDFDTIFGTTNVFPLIFDPLEKTMDMLYLCCGLGIFHMMCGLIIKIVMCIRAKDYASAIFDNVSWILIVLGAVVILVLPDYAMVGGVAAGIGALMVLFFAGRTRPNIAKRLMKGAGSLYDVTSYISDTLSYARIFALGMATGVMGEVFNSLGEMLYSGTTGVLHAILLVVAMVMLVALHAFSLVINTLGTFVHTARLQYIEYFGKFYEAGGREFRPLAYRTKNVKVTK